MLIRRFSPWFAALVVLTCQQTAEASHRGARCARISDGTIVTSEGEPVTLGFDEWGYHYQARLFHGAYCDATRGAACDEAYADVQLRMKWNDAWLSNRDCDGDNLLDRHYGFDSYRGTGAALTNIMWSSYELDGRTCRWAQISRIVAAPLAAELIDGIWYDSDGDELGPDIWGEFIVLERRLIDPCGAASGEPASTVEEAVDEDELVDEVLSEAADTLPSEDALRSAPAAESGEAVVPPVQPGD